MKKAEEKIKEIISNTDFDPNELQKYEKSLKEFEEMVSKGMVKRRGYTLLTIEEATFPTMTFNSMRV